MWLRLCFAPTQFAFYSRPLTNNQLSPTRHWPEMFVIGQVPETTRKDLLATVSPFLSPVPIQCIASSSASREVKGFELRTTHAE
jgi:hypothetical protein